MTPNTMFPKYDRTRPGGLDAPIGVSSLEMPIRSLVVTPDNMPKLPTDGRLDKKRAGQLALAGEVTFDGYL